MSDERLLERFRSLERDPLRREGDSRERLLASILGHLRLVLNTRQGSAPIAADYGVPDFQDFLQSYPESVRELELSIRQVIERYEPRLAAVRVSFLPREDQGLFLRFQIEAQLAESTEPVRFQSVLSSEGRISVGS